MSVLYVYAIADAGTETEVPGLRGATVRAVRAGTVDVLVSEHDRIEPMAELSEVWAHEAVVESAGEGGRAVLPLRMGTVLRDEDAVIALVREREEEFMGALDRVRGAAELGIRAAVTADEAPPSSPAEVGEGPGTAYLMTRLAQKQRGDEIMSAVHRPLAELARDHVRLDRAIEPSSVRLAYLVDEDAIEPFRERVLELEGRLHNVRVACTGPWPPYSFTGGPVE